MVELIYNADQFILVIIVIFMLTLMYIGEMCDKKKDGYRRGLYFMFVFIIGVFGGGYLTQAFEWYIPFTLISIGGFWGFRAFLNLGLKNRVI